MMEIADSGINVGTVFICGVNKSVNIANVY